MIAVFVVLWTLRIGMDFVSGGQSAKANISANHSKRAIVFIGQTKRSKLWDASLFLEWIDRCHVCPYRRTYKYCYDLNYPSSSGAMAGGVFGSRMMLTIYMSTVAVAVGVSSWYKALF